MPSPKDLLHGALMVSGVVLVASCGSDSTSPTVTEASALTPDQARGENDDDGDDDNRGRGCGVPGGGGVLEFADLEIFLEFNSTDSDLGVHVSLDAEGWDCVRAVDPYNKTVLDIRLRRELGDLGLKELRFESVEPSPAEVLGSIPAGRYDFFGRTVEGDRLIGSAELSHVLPPAPIFTPANGALVDPNSTEIEWAGIAGLAGYELILTNEDGGSDLFVELV